MQLVNGRARVTQVWRFKLLSWIQTLASFSWIEKTLPANRDSHLDPPLPMDAVVYGCARSGAAVLPTWSPRKAMRNSSPDPYMENYQSSQWKVWMLHFIVVTLSMCGGWGLGKGIRMFHGLLKGNPGQKWGKVLEDFFNVSLSLPTAPSIFHSWLLSLY